MPEKTAGRKGVELPILQLQDDAAKPSPKSGRGRIRACVLILVHLVILAHITHFFLSGRSISPVEPSEAMYTIELGQLNAGAIFFGIAILSTVIFGRFFCGWACHIVALQDLCSYGLRRIGIRPKPLRSRLLVLVPFALAFYMFLWPTLLRLLRGDPHPGFSNHLITHDFWQTFPDPIVSILTFVVCGGLIVYLLGNKGFCTYACPYAAFFSVSDRVAGGRIRVTDDCQHCGQCTAHCTSNVQIHAEVRDFGMVVDPGCMKCMDCVSVCPNDALYYGFRQKEGSAKLGKESEGRPTKGSRRKKHYDFSLSEEMFGLGVAAVSVYALRGLYDIPPLLLAVALAVITAYLAIQCWRMIRKRDLRIQSLQLKRNRRFTKTGRWVLALLMVWFAFNIHSFIVQHHRYRGREHLNRVQATWDELLDGLAQPHFTPQDHKNLNTAMRSFRYSDQIGMVDVVEVKIGLAMTNIMKGEMAVAERYLREAYQCNPDVVRDMIMEFLVSQDRPDEAAEFM